LRPRRNALFLKLPFAKQSTFKNLLRCHLTKTLGQPFDVDLFYKKLPTIGRIWGFVKCHFIQLNEVT
jgi:hypothetical protein